MQTRVLWKSKLRSWGYEPTFFSVKTKRGLDSLLVNLRDQTTVIVGPSGAGKSSLINALGSNHYGLLLDDSSNSVRNMIGSMQCASSDCLHLGERGCLVTTSWERYPHYCGFS